MHIVEFLDPACETCREFHPLVKRLMQASPGRIRLQTLVREALRDAYR